MACIGLFLEQDLRAEIEAKRLTRLLEDWTPPLGAPCLYHPSRRNASAALKAFVDLALQASKLRKTSA